MESLYKYSPYSQSIDSQALNFSEEYQHLESYAAQSNNVQTASSKHGCNYRHLNSQSFTDNTKCHRTSTNDTIRSWEQLLGETSASDQVFPDSLPSEVLPPKTNSFEFQKFHYPVYEFNRDLPPEEISSSDDYETLVRSKHLYYDPNPKVIRKPTLIKGPLVYNQNILLRFLKPPPVAQEPLIVREIRPPQPPPLPPLVSLDLI